MPDKYWSKENIEQCYVMTQREILHIVHIMENKACFEFKKLHIITYLYSVETDL